MALFDFFEHMFLKRGMRMKRYWSVAVIALSGLYGFASCSSKKPGDGENFLAFFQSFGKGKGSILYTPEPSPPDQPLATPLAPSDTGFGSNGPEVKLDFDPLGIDPYSNIRLRFSHSVDTSTLSLGINLILKDGNNVTVPTSQISLIWTSPVTLNIRTNPALQQNMQYSIEVNPTSALTKLQTEGSGPSQDFHHFLATFKTDPSFPVQLSVRSGSTLYPFSNNNALVLDSGLHPQSGLHVRIQFTDPTNLTSIKSLVLCKLGAESSSATIPCTEGVGRGIELCAYPSCTAATIETALDAPLPTELQPKPGVNNYFYRIETFSNRYIYRTLNFVWGNLQKANPTTLNPQNRLNLAANLSIVQNQGASAVAGLIEAFAKGEFTLKDPLDNVNKSLNAYLNSSATTHPGVVDGNPCLAWPTGKLPNGMKYLNRVGPFCGITVSGVIFESTNFPDVAYSATADIYITELNLDESVWNGSEWIQNAQLTINPEDGYMDLTLNGKKASGKMAIIARVDSIEFFDYLLNDTLIYYTPPPAAPLGSNPDGGGINFALNESNTTPRRAFARTKITANAAGDAVITIHPFAFPNPFNLNTQCGSLPDPVPFPFTFLCNPYTMAWSDNITTSSIVGSGAVAAIVADVIQQKIPEVKPKIVQGVIRDIAVKVAPDILNNILGQVRNGITVGLPNYLPAPLNQVNLTIAAQLAQGDTVTRTRRSGLNFGLEAPAHAALLACIKDSANRCPWQAGYSRPPGTLPPVPTVPGFLGQDSFVVLRNGLPRNLPSTIDRWSSNPGVLLSIHEDALNQAFFWLWKTGGLNLTVNKNFIDSINGFTGGSSLLRLTNSLLKADPILAVLAPGASNFAGIYPNDDVELVLTPVIAPQVSLKPMTGSSGNAFPKIYLNLSDLKLAVIGKASDPARGPSPPNTPYTISHIRISLQAEATLNLGTYQLPAGVPPSSFSPSVLASVGNPSIQIQISSDPGKLYYILEVLDDTTHNPLGLRPDGIYEVIEPLVKDLIVPLLNNIVRDIPIPKLRACGLDLTNVKTLPIPVISNPPYLLIHANAGNYGFYGNCEL